MSVFLSAATFHSFTSFIVRGQVRQTQTADWQVNKVNIVVKCSNRFLIPKA